MLVALFRFKRCLTLSVGRSVVLKNEFGV